MKYFSKDDLSEQVFYMSKVDVRGCLSGYYDKEFVDRILDNDLSFRLPTYSGEIYTVNNDGLSPIAGFYGVCE